MRIKVKEQMKISIITIAFNNEKDIRATIESVVNQSYKNIEYIIVDGASTDNTLNIVKEYQENIDKIISEPDRGIYDAINKGIMASTGDVVGLIHAGDQLFDNDIIAKIAQLFLNNKIEASYGHSHVINKNNRIIRINKSPKYDKVNFKYGWMPSHQSIYIRREVFDKLGLYRIDLGGSGDYEFVLRYFFKNNLNIKLLDKFIVKFSIGGTSTSNYSKIFQTQRTHIRCWTLNGLAPPFYLIPMKLARKIPQFSKAIMKNFHIL